MTEEVTTKLPVSINDHLQIYWNLTNEASNYKSQNIVPRIRAIGQILGFDTWSDVYLDKIEAESWAEDAGLKCTFIKRGSSRELAFEFIIPQKVLRSDSPTDATHEFARDLKIAAQEKQIAELQERLEEINRQVQAARDREVFRKRMPASH
jgi:hypothetical protein